MDIFVPGLAKKTILATCLGATALLGTWGSVQWTPSWADKMSRDELREWQATVSKVEERLAEDPGGENVVAKISDETLAKVAEQQRRARFAKSWTQMSASAGAILGTILAAFLADWQKTGQTILGDAPKAPKREQA